MKKCCMCKENKDLCEFSKNKTQKDGLQKRCKDCSKIAKKKPKIKKEVLQEGYKRCTTCSEIKELEGFGKNKNTKDGLCYSCKICHNIKGNKWKKDHPVAVKDSNTKYNKDNQVLIKTRRKQKYDANPELQKEKNSIYNNNHSDQVRETKHRYCKKYPERRKASQSGYEKRNPDKNCAKSNKRRAAKLDATPKDLTQEDWVKIGEFYTEARRLTLETGVQHHVDHIIPLQGDNGVRGEHAPWNLQVLTATDNLKKGNKI